MWDEEYWLLAAANAVEPVQQDQGSLEALESDAEFDHVLFDAQQFGLGSAPGSADEQDFLGLPGLLEPDQVSHLLRQHQSRQVDAQPVVPAAAHRALAAQRKELNSLVAAFARKSGDPHAKVHSDLRRSCGGPALDRASGVEVGAKPALPSDDVRGEKGSDAVATPTNIGTREQRRLDAVARDAIAKQKKPIEQRIRRIETRLAEAETRKRAIEESLALPDAYADDQRERLKQQLIEQAYVTREIEQLEAEWLEQHTLLEKAA